VSDVKNESVIVEVFLISLINVNGNHINLDKGNTSIGNDFDLLLNATLFLSLSILLSYDNVFIG